MRMRRSHHTSVAHLWTDRLDAFARELFFVFFFDVRSSRPFSEASNLPSCLFIRDVPRLAPLLRASSVVRERGRRHGAFQSRMNVPRSTRPFAPAAGRLIKFSRCEVKNGVSRLCCGAALENTPRRVSYALSVNNKPCAGRLTGRGTQKLPHEGNQGHGAVVRLLVAEQSERLMGRLSRASVINADKAGVL